MIIRDFSKTFVLNKCSLYLSPRKHIDITDLTVANTLYHVATMSKYLVLQTCYYKLQEIKKSYKIRCFTVAVSITQLHAVTLISIAVICVTLTEVGLFVVTLYL
jgi:hypothetical protein